MSRAKPSAAQAPALPRGPLAVVEVNHTYILLPSAAALKVIELLQKGIEVKPNFDHPLEMGYAPRGVLRLELRVVTAAQIAQRKTAGDDA